MAKVVREIEGRQRKRENRQGEGGRERQGVGGVEQHTEEEEGEEDNTKRERCRNSERRGRK